MFDALRRYEDFCIKDFCSSLQSTLLAAHGLESMRDSITVVTVLLLMMICLSLLSRITLVVIMIDSIVITSIVIVVMIVVVMFVRITHSGAAIWSIVVHELNLQTTIRTHGDVN